jgi:hypothetical protein
MATRRDNSPRADVAWGRSVTSTRQSHHLADTLALGDGERGGPGVHRADYGIAPHPFRY